jgi:hypothetical protein
MLAMDWFAQLVESRRSEDGGRHAHFKLRDPGTGRFASLAVELPRGASGVSYPSLSRDGRHVYMNAGSWLVRWDLKSPRAEIIADMAALGGGWPGMTGLDSEDNPLVTRDLTDREIVVMDLEWR